MTNKEEIQITDKRNVTVILKETKASLFQKIINIIAMVAIPIVLGFSGFFIQQKIENQKIDQVNIKLQQEYIKIALSVIDDQEKVQPDLLEWAVDVLVKHSDPPIPKHVATKLKEGKAIISSATDPSNKFERSNRPLEKTAKSTGDNDIGKPIEKKWATPGVWFTVLASYSSSQKEKAFQRKKELKKTLASQSQIYDVNIYMTEMSKHYAVTIGGELTKSDAISLAKISRNKGWASDAFAQINKSWYLIEQDI